MEALTRLAEAGLSAATAEAALREAEAAAEAAVTTAWAVVPDVRTASGRCNCGEEVIATVTGETLRWEERPLAAAGQTVCALLAPWLSSGTISPSPSLHSRGALDTEERVHCILVTCE